MWSAPRSLSTVLLYSFAQHPDCQYFDEPFLWPYLKSQKNYELKGTEPYLQSELADAQKQLNTLLTPTPGKTVHYVKNMAYQWGGLPNEWMDHFTHAFLIRSPEKTVASYLKNCTGCRMEDFALDKLWDIYQRAEAQGQLVPVIDADDLLDNPELFLRALCLLFDIPFATEMLNWRPGPLPGNITLPGSWYDDVMNSSGFRQPAPQKTHVQLDAPCRAVVNQMNPFYERLHRKRLTPEKAERIRSNGES